jgi:hypothetical protein
MDIDLVGADRVTAWVGVIALPLQSNSMPVSRLGWRIRIPELRWGVLLRELRLNRVPQRLIDDRRVFAGMAIVRCERVRFCNIR